MKAVSFSSPASKMLQTTNDWYPLILRSTLAIVMWPHGAQLLLGWFGGYGFTGTMEYFIQTGLPWVIGFLVILIQFFGSLFILAGLFTRLASFGMLVIGVGMIFSGHIEHGFFMNWFGNQQGEGFEFHLLLLGICAALILTGGGKLSIDKKLSQ